MIHDSKKRGLGQFFTTEKIWLKDNVKAFITSTGCTAAYDPFAGSGDLLNVANELGFSELVGLDIDEDLGWKVNDSLFNIPQIKNAVIITNPPYLSNYSAKRRKILDKVEKYFAQTKYDDLYLLSLARMLQAQSFVVAIIPETFINSSFPKDRLFSINILEENPFTETETPVCVACFDGNSKSPYDVKIYKNGHFITTLGELDEKKLHPKYDLKLKFNSIDGKVGLRAVDTTDPNKRILFMKKEELDYDLKGIKHSSRIITVIEVNLDDKSVDKFISTCNRILEDYRKETDDILLSPFKGNMKNGVRRRRLDYEACRAIMEMAYKSSSSTGQASN